MTARDLVAHDQAETYQPRRRRSLSTASSISPTPSVSKRSPSPRVAFTASTLGPDGKAVKNITRKVIRRLEELGHPAEALEMGEVLPEETETEEIVEDGHAPNGTAKETQTNGRANGRTDRHANGANGHAVKAPASAGVNNEKKVDWEIPRKLLHSSIGFLTIYLWLSRGNPKNVVVVLWTALLVIVPADILRLSYPPFERLYERVLGFLMRESEKKTTNGVIWYILGVNFALTFYPLDVATVSILILSWADTAASTFGRMFGSRTPRLPRRLPFLRLPLAPRKSLAGFIAASVTGACIAAGFWGCLLPYRTGSDITWSWSQGARAVSTPGWMQALGGATVGHSLHRGIPTGGWLGLTAVSAVAGLVSGVAEALDLGSLDDNLTLPIISGGCILGFLKVLGWLSSSS
ncbi:hypothetical protein AX16_003787 [Volvariella volvacea WC 439]|nr:hypothetical protein AX16_003787 [Volvariella volvacea WC 439]